MTAVYVAPVCHDFATDGVYPPERRADIEAVANAETKAQKLSVWLLLELALKDGLGLDMRGLKFRKEDSGKWSCSGAYFSLSHTDGMVAAAVSDKPVGVDIERVARFEEMSAAKIAAIAQRIASCGERAETPLQLARLWTGKESVFKCFDNMRSYADMPIIEYPVRFTERGQYALSVCAVDGEDFSIIDCVAEGKGYCVRHT